jgi:CheY-like chemotaxis protein
MKTLLNGYQNPFPEYYILLADDDEDDRYVMNELFINSGYTCTMLTSGLATIQFLQSPPQGSYPSLILLDYTMPPLSGEEVLIFIQRSNILKQIPVVIYSSEMNEHLKCRLEASGAYTCFSKSYLLNQLHKNRFSIETLLNLEETF